MPSQLHPPRREIKKLRLRSRHGYTVYLISIDMRPDWHTSFIVHRNLQCGIALFFVLFTVLDILSPHLCSEDLGGLTDSPARAANASAVDEATPSDEAKLSIANDASQPTQPAVPSSTDEEDCFCCCSHVLPGLSFSIAVLHFRSPEADLQQDLLRTPALRALYHPPRFV